MLAHFPKHLDPVGDAALEIADADQHVVLDLFKFEPASPVVEMKVGEDASFMEFWSRKIAKEASYPQGCLVLYIVI